MTTIGATLAERRKLLGWSLRTAEKASGVHNAHISQIETGAIARPGPGVVAPLCAAYGLPVTVIPEVAEAVAAERQRIIALARKLGATYPVTLDAPPGSERQPTHTAFPFADYLEDTGGAP